MIKIHKIPNKLIKYGKLLFDLNVFQTIQLNIKAIKVRGATLRVFNYSNLHIDKEARLELKPKSFLGINQLNLKRKKIKPCTLWLSKEATLICHGSFTMFEGAVIVVLEGGRIELGNKSYMNESVIQCSFQITIGDGCAIASGVLIQDTDFHTIVENGVKKASIKPITISNRVWICANATILKGVTVGEGSVVAAGAVVTKDVPPNCIVAGNPAKVIKTNVSWI